MSVAVYLDNQHIALELLGYQYWLSRAQLRDKHFRRNPQSAEESSQEKVIPPTPQPAVFNAQPAIKEEDFIKDEGDSVIDLGKQYTLSAYGSATFLTCMVNRQKVISVLPPLWGAGSRLNLWQSPLEGQLLDNALRYCHLYEIADMFVNAREYLNTQDIKLNLTMQLPIIEADYYILWTNCAKLTAFDDTKTMSIIHPYQCLFLPENKAILWQQLRSLQAKLC